MGDVIKFPRPFCDRVERWHADPALVIVLPIVRLERHAIGWECFTCDYQSDFRIDVCPQCGFRNSDLEI